MIPERPDSPCPRNPTGVRLLQPDWPAPANVRAVSTTRGGGHSREVYAGFNLGAGCGDNPRHVAKNRRLLRTLAALPAEPVWLRQVHGTRVLDAATLSSGPPADASFSATPGVACAVLSADCLPVLLCDEQGRRVAAAHAGWRGLAAGVLESTVTAMQVSPPKLLAWLGPAIGPLKYEVGDEVREHFITADHDARSAFQPSANGRWLADLYALATGRLQRLGIQRIHGGHYCTHSDPENFFSYRRDGICGRMASCIWLQS